MRMVRLFRESAHLTLPVAYKLGIPDNALSDCPPFIGRLELARVMVPSIAR